MTGTARPASVAAQPSGWPGPVLPRAARWLLRLPSALLFLLLGALTGGWALLLLLTVAASIWGTITVLLLVVATLRLLTVAEWWRLRLVGLRVLPARPRHPLGAFGRLIRCISGGMDRRQARYLAILGPVGVACGVLCWGVWSAAYFGLVDGNWDRTLALLPWPAAAHTAPSLGHRAFSVAVLVPVAAVTSRLLADAQTRLATALLDDAGERRITQVLASRARAVDAQTAELRRIERDLHDGAQARIVALTMQLALVGRALRPLGTEADPARTRLEGALVTANAALADLRHLVRGIYPPILSDRGLAAAVSALATDCTVPVDLDLDPGTRFDPAVEAAAYFTVAEALTNAAKHAAATRCQVTVHRDAELLHIGVTDDGRGGADPGGPGLTGMRHRIEALDGRLSVTSPTGGPTAIRVELPCG